MKKTFKYMTKTFKYNNSVYKLYKNFYSNGAVYFGLYDVTNDEPYADVTTNIPPYTSNHYVCFNHDFVSCCPPKLVKKVTDYITDGINMGVVDSGFNSYVLYKINLELR